MRTVIQRVKQASVSINGKTQGEIENGLLLLLGIEHEDTREDADWLLQKIIQLRIFSDQEGKMNLSLKETGGAILLISQFTLYASTKKGNRPGFTKAARPETAIPLYEYFIAQAKKEELKTETGIFGADMQVSLTNDGPVTLIIDSKNKE